MLNPLHGRVMSQVSNKVAGNGTITKPLDSITIITYLNQNILHPFADIQQTHVTGDIMQDWALGKL